MNNFIGFIFSCNTKKICGPMLVGEEFYDVRRYFNYKIITLFF